MYARGRKAGTTRFKTQAAEAGKAAVAGDFNGWQPAAMRRQKDGAFAVTLALPPGRYEYKFVLDGGWVHDTDAPDAVMNCHGTFNSVAVVD